MILNGALAPAPRQGSPSPSKAAPLASSKQVRAPGWGDSKNVSLCPESQVLGVWLQTALLDPTSFKKQNVPTGEAGSWVQAGTASFPRVVHARCCWGQFCCKMRFSSSSAERSRKAADSR